MEQSDRVKVHCNRCLHQTNHDVITVVRQSEVDEANGHEYLAEVREYELLRCCGCENITLRLSTQYSSGDPETEYFPPPVSRRLPSWLHGIAALFNEELTEIAALLREVYSALYAGNNRLVMMGTRAVIDLAITIKLGDCGNFKQKLDQARDKGYISSRQHDVLSTAIDAGSAAVHRSYLPELEDLYMALDIAENLVQALFVLEGNASALAKKTPPRSKQSGQS